MTKNFIQYILVFVSLFSCFSYKAMAQDIHAVAKLEQTTIRIGDQIQLHLSVLQDVKEQVKFPVLADSIGKIQVVSTSKQDTIKDPANAGKITVTQSIVLTAFDAGVYPIPELTFTAQSGTIQSNALSLDVQSVKVDTTKAIYDIKQPMAVSYTFMDWIKDNWQGIAAALAVVLIIGLAIWYFKKRPKTVEVIPPAAPPLPVHTIALNRLNELRDKKLWQRDEVKLYYSELSDVMRDYLAQRYGVKTQEKTTDEIITGIKHLEIQPEQKNMLHQLLITSDLVKFAKEKPGATENELQLENAIGFILKTKEEERVQKTDHPIVQKGGTEDTKENIKGGAQGGDA